jgi:hypothetical protein
MSDGDSPSRRTLLGQLGAVGLAGLTFGAGTNALVSESESFPRNAVQSRRLDLKIAQDTTAGEASTASAPVPGSFDDANAVSLQLNDLEAGTTSTVNLALAARPCDLPVEIWMRVTGTNLGGDLASVLRMEIELTHECGAGDPVTLASGSVASAVTGGGAGVGLQTGVPIRNECAGSRDPCRPPVCVDAAVQVPEEIPNPAYSQSLSLRFEFVARQCTGGDDQNAGESPWNE